VHSETVPLGASNLTASFTDWPVKAWRSLEMTFVPTGGIADRTAEIKSVSPSGEAVPVGVSGLLASDPEHVQLPRHPRARDAWGLDLVALPEEGLWHLEFTVQGPEGTSTATLPIQVGPTPGPPLALSWTLGLLPWLAVVPFLIRGWIRSRSYRVRVTRAWSG
jgi:hypothetical protein